jgi:hypothetical protein
MVSSLAVGPDEVLLKCYMLPQTKPLEQTRLPVNFYVAEASVDLHHIPFDRHDSTGLDFGRRAGLDGDLG